VPRARIITLLSLVLVFFALCGCAAKNIDALTEAVCAEPDHAEWDTDPKIVHWAKPKYPEIARRTRAEGTVVVTVWLSANGTILDIIPCTNSGPLILERSAVNAAGRCKFLPAKKNGRPVRSTVNVPFSFRMN
jgi:periplasmic protein TonB